MRCHCKAPLSCHCEEHSDEAISAESRDESLRHAQDDILEGIATLRSQ